MLGGCKVVNVRRSPQLGKRIKGIPRAAAEDVTPTVAKRRSKKSLPIEGDEGVDKPKTKRKSKKAVDSKETPVLPVKPAVLDREIKLPSFSWANHQAVDGDVLTSTRKSGLAVARTRRAATAVPAENPEYARIIAATVGEAGSTGHLVNRAGLCDGKEHWFAIHVREKQQEKFLNWLKTAMANMSPLLNPDTGRREPRTVASLVPSRKEKTYVASKDGYIKKTMKLTETGNAVMLVQFILDNELIEAVEGHWAFVKWRDSDVFIYPEEIAEAPVTLVKPASQAFRELVKRWEATVVDPEAEKAKVFGAGGGTVIGQDERRDKPGSKSMDVDETGRAFYKTSEYTGGLANPSAWYVGSQAAEAAEDDTADRERVRTSERQRRTANDRPGSSSNSRAVRRAAKAEPVEAAAIPDYYSRYDSEPAADGVWNISSVSDEAFDYGYNNAPGSKDESWGAPVSAGRKAGQAARPSLKQGQRDSQAGGYFTARQSRGAGKLADDGFDMGYDSLGDKGGYIKSGRGGMRNAWGEAPVSSQVSGKQGGGRSWLDDDDQAWSSAPASTSLPRQESSPGLGSGIPKSKFGVDLDKLPEDEGDDDSWLTDRPARLVSNVSNRSPPSIDAQEHAAREDADNLDNFANAFKNAIGKQRSGQGRTKNR